MALGGADMSMEPGRGKSEEDVLNQLREDESFRKVVAMVKEPWFGRAEYEELVETMVGRGYERESFRRQLDYALERAGKKL